VNFGSNAVVRCRGPISGGMLRPELGEVNVLKAGLALLICFLVVTPSLFAQKRLEAGVFLDYLDVSQTSTNNFGLGARFGYRVHRDFMLEGELAYDYGINFGETYRNIVNGNIAAIENTSLGVTHGLFGLKIQPSGGGFRPFITPRH
jgi:hypothetical protein